MKIRSVNNLILFTFTISLMTCLSSYAQSPQSIGTITSVEGVADVSRSPQETNFLKDNDEVYLFDRIRTKSYSKVEITFLDKSVLRVAPNTCVSINEYSLDDKFRRNNAVIKLSRGEVEAVVSKTGKPETFHIETPNANAKVKGSDIFVFYQGGRTGALVKEGLMSLSNPITPDKKIDLGKGDFSLVPFNESPQDTRPYLDADLSRHKKEVSPSLTKKWVSYKGVSVMTASVTIATGTVRVYKKGATDWRSAKKGELLIQDDKLQTGEDGVAEVILGNGNSILLGFSTELVFEKMEYDPKTGEYNNTFGSSRGKVKAVIEKLGKNSVFQVKTPTAICGARGTVMLLDISSASTQAFYEGGGGIVTSTISGNTQNVEPGQNCMSGSSGSISSPAYTSTDQQMSMDQSFGSQDMASDHSGAMATSENQGGEFTAPTMGEAIAGVETTDLALTEITEATTPPFEQVAVTTASSSPASLWNSTLNMSFQSGFYAGFSATITAYSDNTWKATYSGTMNASSSGSWFVQCGPLASDNMTINSSSPITVAGSGSWATSSISGTFKSLGDGQDHPVSSGSGSGTFSGGSISGTANGTWS